MDNLETMTIVRETIRNGQSRDTDIDIHKKKDVRDRTIRNGQSRDTDIEYTRKRR